MNSVTKECCPKCNGQHIIDESAYTFRYCEDCGHVIDNINRDFKIESVVCAECFRKLVSDGEGTVRYLNGIAFCERCAKEYAFLYERGSP